VDLLTLNVIASENPRARIRVGNGLQVWWCHHAACLLREVERGTINPTFLRRANRVDPYGTSAACLTVDCGLVGWE
jgi:hypothetical protein